MPDTIIDCMASYTVAIYLKGFGFQFIASVDEDRADKPVVRSVNGSRILRISLLDRSAGDDR